MLASRISRMGRKYFEKCLLISLLLSSITLTLYWPVQSFDFVYDDGLYVAVNQHVHGGLTLDGLKWSFTTFHAGNWHPLAWLSHMADVELYGLDTGGHHWTSVLIHMANAILLFLVLSGMTLSLWTSALVAALFAIHPLHVESVAWVSERKDVLSGLFWILTMGAYVHYVRRSDIRRYLLVLFSFTLGLLSKPMVVTLPFVLLLLDYWPLQRLERTRTAFDKWVFPGRVSTRTNALRLIIEKMPLLMMVAILSVVTIFAQGSVNAIWSLEDLSYEVRFANALVSYMEYIQKMLWPVDLAVLYPHAGLPYVWKIAVALIFLASISYLAFRKAREFPFLLVGWLWYLGTLVPVIGLVQVGSQAMADRYTYLPLVGLFIVVAWGAKSIVERKPEWSRAIVVFILVTLSSLLLLGRSQVDTWRNSITLFEHALLVTKINPLAQHNIGAFYLEQNDCKKAVPHFLKAIEMKNDFSRAFHGLGVCAVRENNPAGALHCFQQAIRIDPHFVKPRIDRGLLFMQQQRFDEAEEDFRQALRIYPAQEIALTNLGMLYIQQGKLGDAEAHLIEALRLNPDSAETHNNLGIAILKLGKTDEAVAHFRQALKLAPENPAIRNNAEQVLGAAVN
jgi:protein O-mannosyl-transferase